MTKFSIISDTHTYHSEVNIPNGIDLLLHCGDFCSFIFELDDQLNEKIQIEQTLNFLDWFGKLKVKHKLLIKGNHDFIESKKLKELCLNRGITFVSNDLITINNVNFYLLSWAQEAKLIEEKIDIIVTHNGLRDSSLGGHDQYGDSQLIHLINAHSPKYFIHGHIHEGQGEYHINKTTIINAACDFNPRVYLI